MSKPLERTNAMHHSHQGPSAPCQWACALVSPSPPPRVQRRGLSATWVAPLRPQEFNVLLPLLCTPSTNTPRRSGRPLTAQTLPRRCATGWGRSPSPGLRGVTYYRNRRGQSGLRARRRARPQLYRPWKAEGLVKCPPPAWSWPHLSRMDPGHKGAVLSVAAVSDALTHQ